MFHPSKTLPPVVFDSNAAAYHLQGSQFNRGDSRRTMSRSELWRFAKCPRKWVKGIPDDENDAMTWGSLIDCLLLTPNLFERDYAVAPETYEKKGMECPQCKSVTDAKKCAKCKCDRVEVTIQKPWDWNSSTCSEWRDEQKKEGKTVVKSDTASQAWAAIARLKEDGEVMGILAASHMQVQLSCDWHDPETGLIVPVKAMLDVVPDPKSDVGDTLFDLKCTNNAERKAWQNRVFNDGLFYQAAMYLDMMNAAANAKYRNFAHIISESDAPYEPVVRPLSSEFLDTGRIQYEYDLARYCKCLAKNHFPGYDSDPVEPEVWMLKNLS